MADKPGTGGEGLFTGTVRVSKPKDPLPPEEQQAFAALEARGGALLLGMLSRLQAVEGILRLERIGRLTAEETVRTQVINNDEATKLILQLETEKNDLTIQLSDAVIARANLREIVNSTAVLASRALTVQPLLSQDESESALLVTRVRDNLADALGIIIR